MLVNNTDCHKNIPSTKRRRNILRKKEKECTMNSNKTNLSTLPQTNSSSFNNEISRSHNKTKTKEVSQLLMNVNNLINHNNPSIRIWHKKSLYTTMFLCNQSRRKSKEEEKTIEDKTNCLNDLYQRI